MVCSLPAGCFTQMHPSPNPLLPVLRMWLICAPCEYRQRWAMILPAWGNSLFVSVTVTGFLSAVDNVCCPMLMCFGFSVKIFSEVTHNRNTPSPSMQSFGGYRTDHGGFFKVLQTELVFGFFLSIFWEIKMKWQKNNTPIIIYMYVF